MVKLNQVLQMVNGILLSVNKTLEATELNLKQLEMSTYQSLVLKSIQEKMKVMTMINRKAMVLTTSLPTQRLDSMLEVPDNQLTTATTLILHRMLSEVDSPTPMLVLVNGGKYHSIDNTL